MVRSRKKQRKRGPRRGSPEHQEVQRQAAFAAIRRLYWEVLPLWRVCARGPCKRHRSCCGDRPACLIRGWGLMPEEVQKRACEQVKVGGPRRIPPATNLEWRLRRYPPSNFVHR